MQSSPVLVVVPTAEGREFAQQVATALGYAAADIVVGTALDAAHMLSGGGGSPSYIVLDVGDRGYETLSELDSLAEYCDANTRVVVLGTVNDVNFYRELRSRGIIEYFTHPARVIDVRAALMVDKATARKGDQASVVTFISAASGDGSSTAALNVAYCLATELQQSVVLIDMDYQFGMIARNLDLPTQFGIKELFEHPDRMIDATLVNRMLAEYRPNLKVIASPNELRMMPFVRPEMIRDLILSLQENYQYIIIDLPHVWTPWVSAALSSATHNVLVAQLWLRSVTHCARMLSVMREIGIENTHTSVVINRSGAKFKEAIAPKEFERVCGKRVDFAIGNDIKTIATAENQGKTIPEVGQSLLARQFSEFAAELHAKLRGGTASIETSTKSGNSGWFKRK